MSTMAKRKAAAKKRAPKQYACVKCKDLGSIGLRMCECQLFNVAIPESLKKPVACPACGHVPCECNQRRGSKWGDPVGDWCGETFNPTVIYLIASSIAFAGGIGIGWVVWG